MKHSFAKGMIIGALATVAVAEYGTSAQSLMKRCKKCIKKKLTAIL